MMKDGFKRTLSLLIGGAGIAYMAWLIAQHQTFVIDSLIPNQLWIGIGFMVLFFIFIFALALRPLAIKRLKWWVVVYAIVIILLAQYTLINSVDKMVYAGDVIKFLGMLIFFLGIAGVLLTQKVKHQVEKAMQEVIEV